MLRCRASADGAVGGLEGSVQLEEGLGTAGREGAGRVQAHFAGMSVHLMEGVSDWWFGTHSQGIAGSMSQSLQCNKLSGAG